MSVEDVINEEAHYWATISALDELVSRYSMEQVVFDLILMRQRQSRRSLLANKDGEES